MKNENIKKQAEIFLYEYGLLEKLKEYGVPHIVGSYLMDVMAWNDLDIDISSESMTLDKLYQLTSYINETFKPTWYEAKQEINSEGNTVWFHGFETMILGTLWNIDLWFFVSETIHRAENYCESINRILSANPEMKKGVITIKNHLIERGLYGHEKCTSMDVYHAVTEEGILTIDDFLKIKSKLR